MIYPAVVEKRGDDPSMLTSSLGISFALTRSKLLILLVIFKERYKAEMSPEPSYI